MVKKYTVCDAEMSLVLFEANCCIVGPQSMMCIVHVRTVCTLYMYIHTVC